MKKQTPRDKYGRCISCKQNGYHKFSCVYREGQGLKIDVKDPPKKGHPYDAQGDEPEAY
jgi:hypothetical protein